MSKGGEKGISRSACVLAALVFVALLVAPSAAFAATIVPTTNTDEFAAGGNCSLREAIYSINGGQDLDGCTASPNDYGNNDTVRLAIAGPYNLSFGAPADDSDGSGDLDVLSPLTITGNGNTITQTFGTDDRILDVPNSNVSLSLQGLTLDGGQATTVGNDEGANLRFDGDTDDQLTLNDVDVKNGTAGVVGSVDGRGGGIWANGDVSIVGGSTIGGAGSGNVAAGALNGIGVGGGIYMIGATGNSLSITDSSVTRNKAGNGGGVGTSGEGGGIRMATPGTLTLNNATIDSNTAGGGGSEGSGLGGGISFNLNSPGTLSVTGGSISHNEAGGGTGNPAGGMVSSPNAAGYGGGVYFFTGSASTGSFNGVTIDSNKAGGNGGKATGHGGAIDSANDLTVADSTITGNTAGINTGAGGAPGRDGTGGAILMEGGLPAALTVTHSTISTNKAGENGGLGAAIADNSTGPLSVSDSTVTGNVAGDANTQGSAQGGGIYRAPSGGTPADSITRTTIRGNTTEGAGGNDNPGPQLGTPQGAGVFAITNGSLTVSSSTVSGNTATGENGQPDGGGLYLDSNVSGPAGTYSIVNSTISGNTATSAAAQGANGGGIATGDTGAANPPSISLRNVTLADNTVSADTAGNPNAGFGGNLYGGLGTNPNTIHLRANIISGGSAPGQAGTENCGLSAPGLIDSQGENVESLAASQCELDAAGDQGSVNPLIAALSPANGGDPASDIPTATRALLPGSPAINSVNSGCPPPATDQRGQVRPAGLCDAGAYELAGVDADGDGVADEADACPTQSGPASNSGCPMPPSNPPASPAPTSPATATTKCKKKKKKTHSAVAAKKCKKKK